MFISVSLTEDQEHQERHRTETNSRHFRGPESLETKAVKSRQPKQGDKNNALVLRQKQGKLDIGIQGDTQLLYALWLYAATEFIATVTKSLTDNFRKYEFMMRCWEYEPSNFQLPQPEHTQRVQVCTWHISWTYKCGRHVSCLSYALQPSPAAAVIWVEILSCLWCKILPATQFPGRNSSRGKFYFLKNNYHILAILFWGRGRASRYPSNISWIQVQDFQWRAKSLHSYIITWMGVVIKLLSIYFVL